MWIYNLRYPTCLRFITINQRGVFAFIRLQVFMVHADQMLVSWAFDSVG
jgi:hypothetical protein